MAVRRIRAPALVGRAMLGLIVLLGLLTVVQLYPGGVQTAQADNGLSVTKTSDGNPMIGGSIVYTITVSNTSFAATSTNPDGKATNVDIVDTLPAGATYVSVSPASAGPPKISQAGSQQSSRLRMSRTLRAMAVTR